MLCEICLSDEAFDTEKGFICEKCLKNIDIEEKQLSVNDENEEINMADFNFNFKKIMEVITNITYRNY